MSVLDDLLAQSKAALAATEANTSLEESIISAFHAQGSQLQALELQLQQAGTDPTKLAELQDVIGSLAAETTKQAKEYAQAIPANTGAGAAPANPEPAPAPQATADQNPAPQ